eukprot:TRINITY_DN31984_c0_g1_i1.p1 TRINITY_DN31984_c0_g1~~TRINITY_DN31984_c0_g1_i1.p1  ORF type:complete len:335 (+),score=147.18 TRINITY_DN31984_c0_g1_i1:58-1062(+)
MAAPQLLAAGVCGVAVAAAGAAICKNFGVARPSDDGADGTDPGSYQRWSSAQLARWLTDKRIITDAEAALLRKERIDGSCVEMLTTDVLKDCGITAVGSRIRLLDELKRLVNSRDVSPAESPASSPKQRSVKVPSPKAEASPRGPHGITAEAASVIHNHLSTLSDLTRCLGSPQFSSQPVEVRREKLQKVRRMLKLMVQDVKRFPAEVGREILPALDSLSQIVMAHDKVMEEELVSDMHQQLAQREEELKRLTDHRSELLRKRDALLQEQRDLEGTVHTQLGTGSQLTERCRQLALLEHAIENASPEDLPQLRQMFEELQATTLLSSVGADEAD